MTSCFWFPISYSWFPISDFWFIQSLISWTKLMIYIGVVEIQRRSSWIEEVDFWFLNFWFLVSDFQFLTADFWFPISDFQFLIYFTAWWVGRSESSRLCWKTEEILWNWRSLWRWTNLYTVFPWWSTLYHGKGGCHFQFGISHSQTWHSKCQGK